LSQFKLEHRNKLKNLVEKLQHPGPHDRPEQLSGQYQGDIVLTQEQLDYFNEIQTNPNSVLLDPTRYWPDATVIYELEGPFSEHFVKKTLDFILNSFLWFAAAAEIEKIEFAIHNMEHHTCLRFVKRTNQADYVTVRVS
jgi:hypothetical protein